MRDGRADYYCFFNANEETVTTAVSLSGSGVPVFLNCWNGKLEAAAEYTRENGKVSMSITLAGGDMIVLGVLPDVKDADRVLLKALPERVIDSFSLKLVSFGPAEETDPEYVEGYPTTYHKTTLCYDAVQNGTPWSKLPGWGRNAEGVAGIGYGRCQRRWNIPGDRYAAGRYGGRRSEAQPFCQVRSGGDYRQWEVCGCAQLYDRSTSIGWVGTRRVNQIEI